MRVYGYEKRKAAEADIQDSIVSNMNMVHKFSQSLMDDE